MSQLGELLDDFIALVIAVSACVIGLFVLYEIGSGTSFQKTYTLEDLKFLKYAVVSHGNNDVIVRYTSIRGQGIRLGFHGNRIEASDISQASAVETMVDASSENKYFTYLIDDSYLSSPDIEINPSKDVVDNRQSDKSMPFIYLGIKGDNFIVKSALKE